MRTAPLPCIKGKKIIYQDMNTPGKPWSTQIQRTSILWGCIRKTGPTLSLSCALTKQGRKTSPSSLINSGKLEGVQRDHRKKIGSVRSKNWNLAISRDGPYDVVDTKGGCADFALYISIPLLGGNAGVRPCPGACHGPRWMFHYVGGGSHEQYARPRDEVLNYCTKCKTNDDDSRSGIRFARLIPEDRIVARSSPTGVASFHLASFELLLSDARTRIRSTPIVRHRERNEPQTSHTEVCACFVRRDVTKDQLDMSTRIRRG